MQLITVDLTDGLEEIGEEAFSRCESLQHIVIPPAVSAIEKKTFYQCYQLANIHLGIGLKEIGERSFQE